MSESPLDNSLEKELELLRKEIGAFRDGVTYIERATSLIRLAERSASKLEVEVAGKPERIEEILTSLQQSGSYAKDTAESLEKVFSDLRADSVVLRIEEVKSLMEEKTRTIDSRFDALASSLDKKLDEVFDALQRMKDRTANDTRAIQTQQDLHATKLSLIEERTSARQKSQSTFLVVSIVVGVITFALAAFILFKL